MRTTKIQIYGCFGRIQKEFLVPENKTHHEIMKEAMEYLSYWQQWRKLWIRIK